MFAATSETDDYLQDSRGIRRYWPVRCQTIDLEVLRAQREQIFAEALIRYREHATWHEVPETETTEEQRDRITQDPWQNRIAAFLTLRREVQIEEILSDSNCINMAKERQTRREVLRVAAILREIGWRKARPKDESGRTYAAWWPTDRLV
jgi:putative DNA primase/helicase